jgi:DNA ligase 1
VRTSWTPPTGAWPKDSPVPYASLCETFTTISTTTKRLEILSYLTSFYRTVINLTPSNLLHCVYLTINRIAPDYEGLELGIGESLLVKAIAESSGRSVAQIKAELEKTGDLGDIAQRSKGAQPTMFKPAPLTVLGVFKSLKEIATTSGHAVHTLPPNTHKHKQTISPTEVPQSLFSSQFHWFSFLSRLCVSLGSYVFNKF